MPKIYSKIIGLDKVNHDLGGNVKDLYVISIAKDSGFWHLGQFSEGYKDFFAHLPFRTNMKI